jgi:hypothetical protein
MKLSHRSHSAVYELSEAKSTRESVETVIAQQSQIQCHSRTFLAGIHYCHSERSDIAVKNLSYRFICNVRPIMRIRWPMSNKNYSLINIQFKTIIQANLMQISQSQQNLLSRYNQGPPPRTTRYKDNPPPTTSPP